MLSNNTPELFGITHQGKHFITIRGIIQTYGFVCQDGAGCISADMEKILHRISICIFE